MQAKTQSGVVIGASHDHVVRFLGIPFAAPPTRTHRFELPQPPQDWTTPRPALEAQPAPPQPLTVGPGIRGAARTSEDCLYLNVFAPEPTAPLRPVLVWIFGGGYVNGDAADALFDGTKQTRAEDLVVVTNNYRLGVWGFAPLVDRNVGLADQVAALRWVHHNIGAFGGDAGNVTIIGESAGAMSVCTLLACPAARGLFHRAIAQSGAAENVGTHAQADETASVLRELLVVDPQHADVATLLEAQRATIARLRPRYRANPLRPHVDPHLLPEHPFAAAAVSSNVPLIIGINRDEYRLYMRSSIKLDDDALMTHVERRLTERGVHDPASSTQRVLAHYRATHTLHPRNPNAALLSDIETELRFRDPMLRYATARGCNTWVYQFDWPSPALRGWLGATHAVEIPFVFGNFALPSIAKFVGAGADATTLSNRMMSLWAHFARHGRPPDSWPAYTSQERMQLHLNREIRSVPIDADATVRLWDELLQR